MENFVRDTHTVNKTWLPSRGVCYPDNIEILVAPITIKERHLLDGASQSEYYRRLLDGIIIRGNMDFNKEDLLFADVQFLDLVRRTYSFELGKKITVSGFPCNNCGNTETKVDFLFTDIEFDDLPEDIFCTIKTFTDEEGKTKEVEYPGKVYKFSDGMEVLVAPLTVGEYIQLAVKYLANISEDRLNEQVTDLYVGQFAYLIKRVLDREYKDDESRREFLLDYVSNLYLPEDEAILEAIETDTTSSLRPIKATCSKCHQNMEVYIQPSYRFQQ